MRKILTASIILMAACTTASTNGNTNDIKVDSVKADTAQKPAVDTLKTVEVKAETK